MLWLSCIWIVPGFHSFIRLHCQQQLACVEKTSTPQSIDCMICTTAIWLHGLFGWSLEAKHSTFQLLFSCICKEFCQNSHHYQSAIIISQPSLSVSHHYQSTHSRLDINVFFYFRLYLFERIFRPFKIPINPVNTETTLCIHGTHEYVKLPLCSLSSTCPAGIEHRFLLGDTTIY